MVEPGDRVKVKDGIRCFGGLEGTCIRERLGGTLTVWVDGMSSPFTFYPGELEKLPLPEVEVVISRWSNRPPWGDTTAIHSVRVLRG